MLKTSLLMLSLAAMKPGVCAATSAASGATFPRRVRDALGRSVVLDQPPQRIVAIFPSNIEIAFALGLESRIAAVGGRVFWPPEARAKPSVGGALGYSAETVAALRPDLIVLTPSHQTALSLIAPFERVGVPVLILHHPDLPSILRNIQLFGEASGQDEMAARVLSSMQAQLEEVRLRLAGAVPRRVYFETAAAARGVFQTVGSAHYANDALLWAGGKNIFNDLKGSVQVSGEAIFARNPEVIISLQKTPRPAAEIAARPGWSALSAVRNKCVRVVERGHVLIPGPRQVEAVLAYARAIHPERFND